MTWDEIADEQRRAAQALLDRKRATFPRAACSRAYYAAYALLAGKANSGIRYPGGRRNPTHPQVVKIAGTLSRGHSRQVAMALSRLWHSRVVADYGVGQVITVGDAKQRLRDCAFIFEQVRGRSHGNH